MLIRQMCTSNGPPGLYTPNSFQQEQTLLILTVNDSIHDSMNVFIFYRLNSQVTDPTNPKNHFTYISTRCFSCGTTSDITEATFGFQILAFIFVQK